MKIRHSLIVCLAACLSALPFNLDAQKRFGIKAGVSVPDLSSDSENIFTQDFGSISAMGIGIYLNVPISSTFSFQPEFLFAVKGGERNGLQPIPDTRLPSAFLALFPPGVTPYAEFSNKSVINYLEIPLLLKYTSPGRKGIAVFGGPFIGFVSGAKQLVSGNSPIFFDPAGTQALMLPGSSVPLDLDFNQDVNIEDEISSTNFGVNAGLDLFTHSGDTKIFFQSALSLGFTKLQNDPRFGESSVGSVTFSLGFSQPI